MAFNDLGEAQTRWSAARKRPRSGAASGRRVRARRWRSSSSAASRRRRTAFTRAALRRRARGPRPPAPRAPARAGGEAGRGRGRISARPASCRRRTSRRRSCSRRRTSAARWTGRWPALPAGHAQGPGRRAGDGGGRPAAEDLLEGDPPLSPTILGLFRGPAHRRACSAEDGPVCRSVVLYRKNLAAGGELPRRAGGADPGDAAPRDRPPPGRGRPGARRARAGMSSPEGGAPAHGAGVGGGARALRHVRPWVWRKDVLEPPAAPGGSVVAVVDPRGQPAGQALWAARSPLALRLLTRRAPAEEPVDAVWFRRAAGGVDRPPRDGRAARRCGWCTARPTACPASSWTATGTGSCSRRSPRGWTRGRRLLAAALVELTGAIQIVCRDDGSGRDFEQLPRESRVLLGAGDSRGGVAGGGRRSSGRTCSRT